MRRTDETSDHCHCRCTDLFGQVPPTETVGQQSLSVGSCLAFPSRSTETWIFLEDDVRCAAWFNSGYTLTRQSTFPPAVEFTLSSYTAVCLVMRPVFPSRSTEIWSMISVRRIFGLLWRRLVEHAFVFSVILVNTGSPIWVGQDSASELKLTIVCSCALDGLRPRG